MDFNNSGSYECVVDFIRTLNVVLYDTSSKQAWLIDGASVLLHIVRAWLYTCESCREIAGNIRSPHDWSGEIAAVETLLHLNNRTLVLSSHQQHAAEGNGSFEHTFLDSYRCFEDLVKLRAHALEFLRDLQTTEGSPTRMRSVSSPRFHLEGYEFNDIVSGKDSITRKTVPLEPSASHWLKLLDTTDTICLLGSGFGDLIQPSQSAVPAPRNLDCLIVPTERLQSFVEDKLSTGAHWIRLANECYWIEPSKSFKSDESCTCDAITQLQTSVPLLAETSRQPDVFASYPTGAVVFGRSAKLQGQARNADSVANASCPVHSITSNESSTGFSDSGIDVASSSLEQFKAATSDSASSYNGEIGTDALDEEFAYRLVDMLSQELKKSLESLTIDGQTAIRCSNRALTDLLSVYSRLLAQRVNSILEEQTCQFVRGRCEYVETST